MANAPTIPRRATAPHVSGPRWPPCPLPLSSPPPLLVVSSPPLLPLCLGALPLSPGSVFGLLLLLLLLLLVSALGDCFVALSFAEELRAAAAAALGWCWSVACGVGESVAGGGCWLLAAALLLSLAVVLEERANNAPGWHLTARGPRDSVGI